MAEYNKEEFYDFLDQFDKQNSSVLSSRVDLVEYSEKLYNSATICLRKNNNKIAGIIAFYANDINDDSAFISLICVLDDHKNKGIGKELMNDCIVRVKEKGFRSIKLEVDIKNQNAQTFYRKFGFQVEDQKQNSLIMEKLLQ